MDITERKTIKEIVLDNHKTAEIFLHYGIDLCKKRMLTLTEICSEIAIPVDSFITELREAIDKSGKIINNPDELEPDELVDYIILNYHNCTKEVLPLIQKNLEKISPTYAKKHPELGEALILFIKLKEELLQHLNKEGRVLFPYIKELAEAIKNNSGKPPASCFTTVNKPIAIMEKGHEIAVEIFEEIKELLEDYEVPEDACTTYKVTLKELESLEEDLQQVLYLENEILFPKVKELEKVFA